jgi:hypothetical protein
MGGDQARELYQRFVSKVQEGFHAERVKDGVFQAMMEVALINDGPVSNCSVHQRIHQALNFIGYDRDVCCSTWHFVKLRS